MTGEFEGISTSVTGAQKHREKLGIVKRIYSPAQQSLSRPLLH